jgi:hypothetical protein
MLQIRTELPHAQAGPGGTATSPNDLSDFSIVAGGPLYQLWRRTRLSGDALELTRRRVLVAVLFTWVPLLLLAVAAGRAWGDGVALTLLQDIETHVRLLIAVPLLILAEVHVHRGLRRIVRHFVDNDLIPDATRSRFDAAIASAMRLRNSVVAELLLLVLVYCVGVLIIRRTQFALDVNTWYATVEDGRLRLTYAGWWGAIVSVPVFQFLVVRWYFRMFVWARFLWHVSRLDLKLEPAHPDGTAGLHFLAFTERAYGPVLLAMGAALAGMMANRIFYTGAALLEFKVEIVGTVALLVFTILGPLLAFTPNLRAARRKGMEEYGILGQRYAREFDRKWIRGGHPADEALLGSADIQSLADLRNSFQVVEGIRMAPFGVKNIMTLAAITLLPVAPLLLTKFSLEQILDRVLNALL